MSGLDWMVAPYLWAASIGTDVRTDVPPADTQTEFPDVIDELDGVFQLHLEGQGDRFGVFADVIFLGVAGASDLPRSHTQSDLDSWLIEAAVVWAPGDERYRGLDLVAGLRYIDLDLTVEVDPVNPLFATATVSQQRGYADLMVGARYTWSLSERWSLALRADGSWGDTEGTWSASAIGQYKTRNGGWLFGYRHLSAEFEAGGSNVEITLSGPAIGYAFAF